MQGNSDWLSRLTTIQFYKSHLVCRRCSQWESPSHGCSPSQHDREYVVCFGVKKSLQPPHLASFHHLCLYKVKLIHGSIANVIMFFVFLVRTLQIPHHRRLPVVLNKLVQHSWNVNCNFFWGSILIATIYSMQMLIHQASSRFFRSTHK